MATESQLNSQSTWSNIGNGVAHGQRLTISNRVVTKLSTPLCRGGSPGGTITFLIRKISDDSIIMSKLWGNSNDVPLTLTWLEVTFDTPTLINEEVYISVVGTGNLVGGNAMYVYASYPDDAKANEYIGQRSAAGVYTWSSPYDFAYIYTYYSSATAPSVTNQAVTSIDKTTAMGNGNVTSLGEPLATKYGHCWAIFPNPTTANSKTEGVPSATGAFTSSLTGLIQNTKYYCRAYITNSVGTVYSTLEAEFTTLADVPVVTTDLVTKVATTTAQGNGSIDNNGGSAVTQHGVCWGLSVNPTIADSKTQEGATNVIGSFFSLMTGLVANTTYYVRAYATNSTGTGYGANRTFKTHIAGTPIVTTEITTSVQATAATGNGIIVDIGGSEVTEHGHCWGTSINPTTADSKTTKGAGSVGAFTSDITGLTAGTTYYIRAYATNSYGTAYGNNAIINQVAGELKGNLAVLAEFLVYTSKTGIQRALLGTEF